MVWPNGSSPIAPTIFTIADAALGVWTAFLERESLAHATAWLAPFPPEFTLKEEAERVSPAWGTRGVKVVRSTLSEPIMVMIGGEFGEVIFSLWWVVVLTAG